MSEAYFICNNCESRLSLNDDKVYYCSICKIQELEAQNKKLCELAIEYADDYYNELEPIKDKIQAIKDDTDE